MLINKKNGGGERNK